MKRAGGCCEYCLSQQQFSTQTYSLEHIFPRALGGLSQEDNLALSCKGCNNHKHDKLEALDPLTQELCPLFHPRAQSWDDHFAWSEDYTRVIGKTPTGRATVSALKLNRDGVVNLRHVLFRVGEHPPYR